MCIDGPSFARHFSWQLRSFVKANSLFSFTKGSQICPIRVESFGYDQNNQILVWTCSKRGKRVNIIPNLELPQFSIEANPSESCPRYFTRDISPRYQPSCLKDRNDPFLGAFSYLEAQLVLKPTQRSIIS